MTGSSSVEFLLYVEKNEFFSFIVTVEKLQSFFKTVLYIAMDTLRKAINV